MKFFILFDAISGKASGLLMLGGLPPAIYAAYYNCRWLPSLVMSWSEVGTTSVIAITLRYVLELSHNASTLWRKVIASFRYRSGF
jgi:hypothetical protein